MKYSFSKRALNMQRSPLRENAKKNLQLTDGISFSYGYPPTEAFPMQTLRKLSDYIYRNVNPDSYLQYGPAEGLPELRDLIKKRLFSHLNLPENRFDNENILITSGATQAMDLVVRILCNEGDQVLCEEQTFSGAVNNIRSYGAVPVPIPMNISEQCVDLHALEKRLMADVHHKIKLMYLIPTFQNPLGTSMSTENRHKLYALAKKYQIVVFEDDPYGELLYSGQEQKKIKYFDDAGLVIYSGSFSKVLAPGIRIGYILTNNEILDKLVLAKQVADSLSNYYWQVMIAEYMKQYDFEGHVKQLQALYKTKLDLMTKKLDEIDPAQLTYIKPHGGFFICCQMNQSIDPSRFYEQLNQSKVSVIPGNIMSVAGVGYEYDFRVNFTKPSLEEISKGIDYIHEALNHASVRGEQFSS